MSTWDFKSGSPFLLTYYFTGIHFEVDMKKVLQPFVSLGLRSFFHAVDTMLHRHEADQFPKRRFNFSLNCQGVNSNHRWEQGPEFYRELVDTTLTMKRIKEEKMKIFKKDGTIRETELKIMNLRPIGNNKNTDQSENVLNKQWEEVSQQRRKLHHSPPRTAMPQCALTKL